MRYVLRYAQDKLIGALQVAHHHHHQRVARIQRSEMRGSGRSSTRMARSVNQGGLNPDLATPHPDYMRYTIMAATTLRPSAIKIL